MSRRLTREEARTLLSRGALVVDVRSEAEYASGHAPGTLNLPMHLLPVLASEQLPLDRSLVVCCHSGGRSAMAVQFLIRQGYEAHDLGPWTHHPDLT